MTPTLRRHSAISEAVHTRLRCASSCLSLPSVSATEIESTSKCESVNTVHIYIYELHTDSPSKVSSLKQRFSNWDIRRDLSPKIYSIFYINLMSLFTVLFVPQFIL